MRNAGHEPAPSQFRCKSDGVPPQRAWQSENQSGCSPVHHSLLLLRNHHHHRVSLPRNLRLASPEQMPRPAALAAVFIGALLLLNVSRKTSFSARLNSQFRAPLDLRTSPLPFPGCAGSSTADSGARKVSRPRAGAGAGASRPRGSSGWPRPSLRRTQRRLRPRGWRPSLLRW